MLKKILLFLVVSLTLFACTKEKYQLKWKIPSGDVLIYNIKMETVDSLSSVAEENLQELVQLVAKMYGDEVNVKVSSKDLYNGLIKQLNLLSYFAIIRHGSGTDLKVDFITRQTKQYEEIFYRDVFSKFIKKAFFKGTLKAGGELLSDANEKAWDPKINILFQLPEQAVAIGDSWEINVVPEWQKPTKEQQKQMVNKVTLADIIVEGLDSIAVLKYELQSPDQSGKMLGFNGEARFNINQGKWISYVGTLAQKTSGVLPMNHVQSIQLKQVSVERYKSLLKQAQKVDIFDTGKDFKDVEEEAENEENNDEVNEVEEQTSEEVNCPEVFRIQLLATKTPVKDKKTQFKGLNYNVDELVLSETETFKYKYTVGMECEREKIEALLSEIKAAGFKQAYVIKTPAK